MAKFDQLSQAEIKVRDGVTLLERLFALMFVMGSMVVIKLDYDCFSAYSLTLARLALHGGHMSIRSKIALALLAINGFVLGVLALAVVVFLVFWIFKVNRLWVIDGSGISFEQGLFGLRIKKNWAYSSIGEAVLLSKSRGLSVAHQLMVSVFDGKSLRFPASKNSDIVAQMRKIINQRASGMDADA